MRSVLVLLLFTVLVGCEKQLSPKEVFINYSNELKSIEDLNELRFSNYFSKRVQLSLKEKLNIPIAVSADLDMSFKANGKELEAVKTKNTTKPYALPGAFLLGMMRWDSIITGEYEESLIIHGDVAEWVNIRENYREDGETSIRTVHFVDEDGWRIDKIHELRQWDTGSIESTSFE